MSDVDVIQAGRFVRHGAGVTYCLLGWVLHGAGVSDAALRDWKKVVADYRIKASDITKMDTLIAHWVVAGRPADELPAMLSMAEELLARNSRNN